MRSLWGGLAAGAYFIVQQRWELAALIVGATLAVGLLRPLIRWLSFSWELGPDEIEMKSGVLGRNHRSIPFDRVQDVNVEQNVIARLLGLARVKLETGASAGDKNEDGVLDSIALADAEALRDLIRAHRAGDPVVMAADSDAPIEQAGEPAPVYAMDLRRLLLAGLFNFSLAVFGVLAGFTQTAGDLLGFDPFRRQFWLELGHAGQPFIAFILANRVVTALFGLATLVLVGLATGLLQTVLREFGFRLDRTETGFRRRRGLLTLTDVVLPLRRVQAAILATGPVRRHFGWTAVKLQSLARDSGHGGDHVVAPLATHDEADAILREMDWRPVAHADDWHRPSPAYVIVFLLFLVPFALAAAGAAYLTTDWHLLLVLALLGFLGITRILAWRRHRHRLDGDRLLVRSGFWRQRTVILPLARIQSIDLKRNFIDRRLGVSNLVLGVAGGSGFAHHGVAALPHDHALDLRDRLLDPVR
nr:PH domain-containing protein [Sphingomicrobium nitratireducens]